MKIIVLVVSLLISQTIFARTFIITDDTGEKFQCTPYNEAPQIDPAQPINKCAANVWKFCRGNTRLNDENCMDKSNKVCKFPYVKLNECIKKEFAACRQEERLGQSVCFDHATYACEMIVK